MLVLDLYEVPRYCPVLMVMWQGGSLRTLRVNQLIINMWESEKRFGVLGNFIKGNIWQIDKLKAIGQ